MQHARECMCVCEHVREIKKFMQKSSQVFIYFFSNNEMDDDLEKDREEKIEVTNWQRKKVPT